jgi:arsenate reductase
MKATIYHNPRCSTSRKTLDLMRGEGVEPTVVEYLKYPPSKTRLKKLIADAGLTVRDAMRQKEAVYAELKLENPKLSDEQLLDAMVANPILIERPIVVTEKGVRLARPIEKVKEIL